MASRDDREFLRRLLGDEPGEALDRWADELADYLDARVSVQRARERPMPEHPWPAEENPMLAYLLDRAREMHSTAGVEATFIWLAVHAWFEGALEERYHSVTTG